MGLFPDWINPTPVTYPILIYPTSAINTLDYQDTPPDPNLVEYVEEENTQTEDVQGVTGVTYG